MYMNAYHKVQGEVRMFEVDARNAIANFPTEWSDAPWPEVVADDATTKKGRAKKADGTQADSAGTDGSGAAADGTGDAGNTPGDGQPTA